MFGRVFSARHIVSGRHVAIKKIQLRENDRERMIKEIIIHRHLAHGNIIKMVEAFESNQGVCLVQELATGGELFELIEPDVGFVEKVAHFYFVQLIGAMVYLRKQGISHRDIKPENLLLDGFGNLKLTDFGFATVFMKDGISRKLRTKCGTPAYMAPEMFSSSGYDGDVVDLWACCVVLVVMLTGHAPWEMATRTCSEFVLYQKKKTDLFLSKVPSGPRRIFENVFRLDPRERWSIDDIAKDAWFTAKNDLFTADHLSSDPKRLFAMVMSNSSTQYSVSSEAVALTQPENFQNRTDFSSISFSQPHASTHVEENDQSLARNVFMRNNFARFICQRPIGTVAEKLEAVLKSMLVPFKKHSSDVSFQFETVDRRKSPLSGFIRLQSSLDGSICTLKKNRGNPIEYARFFKYIASQFEDYF